MPALPLLQFSSELAFELSVAAHVVDLQSALRCHFHRCPLQKVVGKKLPTCHSTAGEREVHGAIVVGEHSCRQRSSVSVSDMQTKHLVARLQLIEQTPWPFRMECWKQILARQHF